MPSNIDATQPPQGTATTAAVRGNFAAAKSEIETLQTAAALAADQLAGLEPVPQIIVGDPGNEGAGILVAGVLYPCAAKISDIGSAYPPIDTLHRHSTALQAISLASRANSDDASHATVTAGMTLWTRMVAGWAGASYKIFGALNFGVKSGATPSDTSAPGRFSIDVTQTNAIWPTEIIGGDEDGIISAVPLSVPPGATGAQAISSAEVDTKLSTKADITDVQPFATPGLSITADNLPNLVKYLSRKNIENTDIGFFACTYTHGVTAVVNGYIGGVFSPGQNRIYLVPFGQANQANWHYIDCATGAVVAYTHGVTAVSDSYIGGVFSPGQNRIYLVPLSQASQANWHYIAELSLPGIPLAAGANNLWNKL